MAEEKGTEEKTGGVEIRARRGEGGTDITGGTDKYGPGGLAESDKPRVENVDIEETGDLMGATTTHQGAGGQMENTGGTGTGPVE